MSSYHFRSKLVLLKHDKWKVHFLSPFGIEDNANFSTAFVLLYIYHFSAVVDLSSEKYSDYTGHKNSWYQ